MIDPVSARHISVPESLKQSFARHADRVAVRSETGDEITYAELDTRRLQCARALVASGIGPGDRVAVWAPNRLEWMVAGLGILSIGAVLVPINTRLRGEEAGFILQRSGARLLFSVAQFLDTDYAAMLAPYRPDSLEQWISLDEQVSPDQRPWQDFLQSAEAIEEAQVRELSEQVGPDNLQDILFTSGTTGHPKGVMTTHAQNLRTIAAWSDVVGLNAQDCYLIANPFFHAFGYKVGWLAGLLAGAKLLPHAVFDAGAILKRIGTENVSVLPGPPTLLQGLLDHPDRPRTDLSSLRATITGAATIAPSLIERIRDELGFERVLTGYGLTETCGVVSLCVPGDDAQTIALSCGRAIRDIEMRCVDQDNRPVPTGESGEIVVRGYNVMRGYLDDPEASAEAIDAQGWLHTGDIGCIDARGYLKITDRLKDMFIVGGFNCYPAEVERILAAHPAIAQVAVVGVPDDRLGEVGKAFVVLKPDVALDADDFRQWCRQHMANYKVPRLLETVATLPMNASGKVQKFQLRKNA